MARYQPAERHARFQKARKAGRTIILSEGDSWFDYPLCLNIIDLLDDERRFAIKRLEFSGDTEAFRDISGYHATWVRAGLRFDYEFGNRRALFITPSQHWSSYSASGDRTSVGFGASATEVEIRADFDRDPAITGNVSRRIEPFLLAVWSHRNKDPNVFSAGLRLTLVF